MVARIALMALLAGAVVSVAGAAQAGAFTFDSGEESVPGSGDEAPASCKEGMAAMSKEGSPSCEAGSVA